MKKQIVRKMEVKYNSMDHNGKEVTMTCEECRGTDFDFVKKYDLDPPLPTTIVTEYKCTNCGQPTSLLKHHPKHIPPPSIWC